MLSYPDLPLSSYLQATEIVCRRLPVLPGTVPIRRHRGDDGETGRNRPSASRNSRLRSGPGTKLFIGCCSGLRKWYIRRPFGQGLRWKLHSR